MPCCRSCRRSTAKTVPPQFPTSHQLLLLLLAGDFSKHFPHAISLRPQRSWRGQRECPLLCRIQTKMSQASSSADLTAGLHGWSPGVRWGLICGVCIAALITTALLPPIPQPQTYHHFADQRTIFGIAHGLDVLSNLAFLVSGLLGLLMVTKFSRALDAGTRWAFATLFFGLVFTSIGSAYYHLAPDNQRLVFDRLPMIIAMAGCGGAVLTDRFGGRTAWAVAPLIAAGLWTVYQWNVTEAAGHGDLRWYALYEGLIMLTGALLLWMFPSRNRATPAFVIAVAGNILAKLFELLDKPIYALGGIVSGHTLKHLCAGLSFLPLVFLIRRMATKKLSEGRFQTDLISAGSAR